MIYVILSAGQRACKDRAVPRLRSVSDRAKKPICALQSWTLISTSRRFRNVAEKCSSANVPKVLIFRSASSDRDNK